MNSEELSKKVGYVTVSLFLLFFPAIIASIILDSISVESTFMFFVLMAIIWLPIYWFLTSGRSKSQKKTSVSTNKLIDSLNSDLIRLYKLGITVDIEEIKNSDNGIGGYKANINIDPSISSESILNLRSSIINKIKILNKRLIQIEEQNIDLIIDLVKQETEESETEYLVPYQYYFVRVVKIGNG